jgi:hypothetical protein
MLKCGAYFGNNCGRRRRRIAVLGCGGLKFSWKYVLKYEVSFGKYKLRKKMARNMRAFFFANSSYFTVEHHILFFSFFFSNSGTLIGLIGFS